MNITQLQIFTPSWLSIPYHQYGGRANFWGSEP